MNKNCIILKIANSMIYILIILVSFQCNSFNKNSTEQEKLIEDNHQKYLDCFEDYLGTIKLTDDYKRVIQDYKDTLNNWIDSGLAVKFHFDGAEWKVEDAVFFNDDKSKCIILVSVIEKDSLDKLDFVKINVGEIIQGSWQFYYKSYPVEYYERKYNNGKPYISQQITNETIYNLCSDGFINLEDCAVNGKYVESDIWFKDWMREMHKEFLHH